MFEKKVLNLNLNDDAINKAMIDGLKTAFKQELKEELMSVAEKKVDGIIDKLAGRLEIFLQDHFDLSGRSIRIECLLKKQGDECE